MDEVDAVEAGGNEAAAAIWMATHDNSHFPIPFANDIPRIKEFMSRIRNLFSIANFTLS